MAYLLHQVRFKCGFIEALSRIPLFIGRRQLLQPLRVGPSIGRDALDAQRIGHLGTLRAQAGKMSLEFNILPTTAGTIIPRGFTSLIKPYLPSLKGKSVLTGLFSSHQK
jgi:hypothetical protein